jgi:threonine dehydrogenase-like Zn-dependent dehydrogenase
MEAIMKAAVLTGKKTLEIQKIPRPGLAQGEVLVQVHYCGICGSDVHLFQQGLPSPNVLGHEFSGVIAGLGPGVSGWEVGDKVTAYPGTPCGQCHWCLRSEIQLCDQIIPRGYGLGLRPGAMAEYVAVDASSLRRLPPQVSLRAAPLTEPLAVVLHGVRMSRMRPGDRAVVLGCGTIGLLAVFVLSRTGAGSIQATDPVPVKRQRALALGANGVHDPDGLSPFIFHQLMDGLGPEVVFECVGIPATLTAAINYVRKAGQVLVLGVGMEPATFLPMVWNFKEVEIRGSYGIGSEYDMALAWLAGGRVPLEQILTRDFPLERAQEAFQLLEGPNEEGKVLFKIAK